MVLTSSAGSKIIYPDQKIEALPRIKKIKGSLTTFAKAGGVTLLTAFVPILHFVLVPVGLIVTGVMSYNAYKRNYELIDFEVHCPHCDTKSQMSVVGQELPLRTFCSNCRNMVYLNN